MCSSLNSLGVSLETYFHERIQSLANTIWECQAFTKVLKYTSLVLTAVLKHNPRYILYWNSRTCTKAVMVWYKNNITIWSCCRVFVAAVRLEHFCTAVALETSKPYIINESTSCLKTEISIRLFRFILSALAHWRIETVEVEAYQTGWAWTDELLNRWCKGAFLYSLHPCAPLANQSRSFRPIWVIPAYYRPGGDIVFLPILRFYFACWWDWGTAGKRPICGDGRGGSWFNVLGSSLWFEYCRERIFNRVWFGWDLLCWKWDFGINIQAITINNRKKI